MAGCQNRRYTTARRKVERTGQANQRRNESRCACRQATSDPMATRAAITNGHGPIVTASQ